MNAAGALAGIDLKSLGLGHLLGLPQGGAAADQTITSQQQLPTSSGATPNLMSGLPSVAGLPDGLLQSIQQPANATQQSTTNVNSSAALTTDLSHLLPASSNNLNLPNIMGGGGAAAAGQSANTAQQPATAAAGVDSSNAAAAGNIDVNKLL